MDFRVGLSKIRVLPPPEERLRSLVRGADHAEAMAGQLRAKAEPFLVQVFALRRRLATLAVALLAIWLFAHVMLGSNGMVVYRAKRAEYENLQKQIEGLQKENDAVSKQVDELQNDPKRIEKEAREQFHYARPGEVIYISPDKPTPPAKPAMDSASK
jgi:cell division protein FtsB